MLSGRPGSAQLVGGHREVELVGEVPVGEDQHCLDPLHTSLLSLAVR